jgi:hypothetical protein
MDLTNEEFFKRINIIAENIKAPIFIYKHPIHEELEAYVNISTFKVANPNVNNYNEVDGINITELITIEWFSLFNKEGNRLDMNYVNMSFSQINPETIKFPANWNNWEWIHKK